MKQIPSSGVRESLWHDTVGKVPHYDSLVQNPDCEVCVIGGGISGLTTAYLLQKAGKQVVLVEAREVGTGETGRTTAHLASALDDGFEHLIQLFGEENAKLACQSHRDAITLIETIVQDEKIACDFCWLKGYLFSLSKWTDADLMKEYQTAKKLDYIVAKEALPIDLLAKKKAIAFEHQAQFHPLKYLYGLAKVFTKLGGKIFTNTFIEQAVEKDEKVLIISKDKKVVTAKYGVVTTNVPFIDRVTMHTKQAAYRSYVVGIEVQKDTIPKALYWDIEEPYHYVRIFERAKEKTNVLIVGGEDHKTGQDIQSSKHFGALEKWAAKYFPGLGKTIYQWSGQVIEPVDSLAFIGLNPGNQNIYIVTGDSGHGLTHGTIGGKIISDLILNKSNPYSKIYDPSRKNVYALGEFVKENVNVAKQYIDVFTPANQEDSEEINKGEGAIVKRNNGKCAVYRDQKGMLHHMSAVCPHLGCIVQWNTAEKSWDCPCHGSRFSAKGKVLNGPAKSDLQKL